MINKNKKGYSISGWTETALFGILILALIVIVVVNMNVLYEQNNDASFGFATEGVTGNFTEYQNTIQTGIKEGEASTDVWGGLSLTSTWSIIKAGLTIIWSFLTGGFIENAVSLMKFPTIVATILRMLYVLSVGYIALRLILKVQRP